MARSPAGAALDLDSVIRSHVVHVWGLSSGNLSRAARVLGMSRVALRRRLRAYGLLRRPGLVDGDQVVTEDVSDGARSDPVELDRSQQRR
jgi:hypothetical protein